MTTDTALLSGSAPVAELQKALMQVDRVSARSILHTFAQHNSPTTVVESLLVPVLEEIGQGWEVGDVALSQVYMSGQVCEELANGLQWDNQEKPWPQPAMAICVLEDFHMLGKQMVYSALKASGYDLHDYGRMDLKGLVPRIKQDGISVMLVSALMLRSALRVADLRAKLNEEGLSVRIVVGGAPFRFDDQLWQEVGADAMARNTAEALQMVRSLS
ncbi:cobalamin B12-binding domain-containing protein [Magnetococcus sp. PR-3]|uniref:cobalamin B12-binding domain-containing protein n=1 Tax=Magnetococcus sp. PR-3 TaxID=3120355 RepID=UPI002FCE5E17